MNEHAVVEAALEFVRADESEAMAERQGDTTWRRSAREVRAVALAKLKEVVAAYSAAPQASQDGSQGGAAGLP